MAKAKGKRKYRWVVEFRYGSGRVWLRSGFNLAHERSNFGYGRAPLTKSRALMICQKEHKRVGFPYRARRVAV